MNTVPERSTRVEHIMTSSVITCTPQDSLTQAAQRMWDADCGCLPVCDGASHVVGMVTDSDICMAALFRDRTLHELRVADAMATKVTSCSPADSFVAVERLMREAKVRRLPVIRDGVLLGMVSLADLAREAARVQTNPYPQITGEEVGITLASICEPRRGPRSDHPSHSPHETTV